MNIKELKEEWQDQTPATKYGIAFAIIVAALWLSFNAYRNAQEEKEAQKLDAQRKASQKALTDPNAAFTAIPFSDRNQGLETIAVDNKSTKEQLEKVKQELAELKAQRSSTAPASTPSAVKFGDLGAPEVAAPTPASPSAAAGGGSTPPFDLNAPPPVSFGPAPTSPTPGTPQPAKDNSRVTSTTTEAPIGLRYRVWSAEAAPVQSMDKPSKKLRIVTNSGIDAIMLTGAMSRPGGTLAGSAGTVLSANEVGAPFVTKIKGEITMPNGWKVSVLGDCFLGGAGVAVLSAQRMYAATKTLACINSKGETLEIPIRGFAVDNDGTLGVAGVIVSKQGTLLAQAWLTGMLGSLSSGMAPTPIPGSNINATGGSTQYQTPSTNDAIRASLFGGFGKSSEKLAEFFLDYAKQLSPILEVGSKTRLTWVVSESFEIPTEWIASISK